MLLKIKSCAVTAGRFAFTIVEVEQVFVDHGAEVTTSYWINFFKDGLQASLQLVDCFLAFPLDGLCTRDFVILHRKFADFGLNRQVFLEEEFHF